MATAQGPISVSNLGDCNVAYQAIAAVLSHRPLAQQSGEDQAHLLEIEILGRSHPVPPGLHILQDENAVAVVKASLALAFIEARRIFLQLAQDISHHESQVLEATAVMLLFDPEHLTAANTRKRILLLQASRGGMDDFAPLLSQETWLVDSLLTSRLNRHTKSPTLWGHRRWLIGMCITTWGLPINVYDSFVKVVMVSAERHPRNYYAWGHARYLMTLHSSQSKDKKCTGLGQATRMITDAVKKWVFRHHTDTSGWSFLEHLGRTLPEKEWAAIVKETAELAMSLRWTGESVWVFLRSAIASGKSGSAGRESFAAAVEALHCTLSREPKKLETVRKAEDWIQIHEVVALDAST
ncbi:hypothetical protein MCOR27_006401 [Pyricularia oryzae]|uniref:Protein prenylyltransferase n=5 Tax=Pyricularia TaxID=48558 RepID=A0ABQ8N9H8_PYRGI|nr:uncharacterized protein MGG_07180 [Pyricularia oryzae 70-15]ELQ37115.1 hypothetical protein OOU_Y34scaffold00618g5 [Pyricularia oryzae Y34]KAH8839774.1 hypothetical protein MCOR01_008950 [Pyricularia oryzae]KAI6293492.1 hypothetical protein MCOR33_009104 [Pyricularia grisea]EHA55577.1 hypothetical protein MGG_07180 [Pyricularia oryzae 70-15]KAH9439636.1 hypothetical protein MCOR02_003176 [Pyricularia oryzae]